MPELLAEPRQEHIELFKRECLTVHAGKSAFGQGAGILHDAGESHGNRNTDHQHEKDLRGAAALLGFCVWLCLHARSMH